MRKTRTRNLSFDDLPDDQKEAEYRAIDREFSLEETKPLTAEDRKAFRKAARRRPGRPLQGKGSQVISLSIERGLLKRADALARKRGVSRARVVAAGLRLLFAKAG